jgi:DNA-binding PadR family transcriptional regulator
MKLEKISDIIPLLEQGHSLVHIGKNILTPPKSPNTMYRYLKMLKKAGYEIKNPVKQGRPKLKL